MTISLVQHPIFIVGAGRSGTTLLRSMLSAHSRISVPPETHFMKWADKEGLERGAPDDFDDFWKRYVSWSRFKDLEVDEARCRELIELQGDRTFRSIFRAVLTAYGESTGKARVGEKTPGHTRYLGRLLEWFPEARVLVVQRDPRAVVASQLHTPWVQRWLVPRSVRYGVVTGQRLNAVVEYAANWADVYERIIPAWRHDSRFHTMQYEALVEDPEGQLRRICDFFDEPFEPSMLVGRSRETVPVSGQDLKSAQLRQWRREHEAKTLQPVNTGSVEKWKNELSPMEVAVVEALCVRGMTAAGYSLASRPTRRRVGRLLSTWLPAAADAESKVRALLERGR